MCCCLHARCDLGGRAPRLHSALTAVPGSAHQAYGVVWKAIDKRTKEIVALKKIFDAFQNATDAQVATKTTNSSPWSPDSLISLSVPPRAPPPLPHAACCFCSPPLCHKQRTFREVMFLQALNNHANIIRCARMRARCALCACFASA